MVKAFRWRLSAPGQPARQLLSALWGGQQCCAYEIYVAAHPAAVGRSLCSSVFVSSGVVSCGQDVLSAFCFQVVRNMCEFYYVNVMLMCPARVRPFASLLYVCVWAYSRANERVCVSGCHCTFYSNYLPLSFSTCLCCGFGFEYFSHLFVVFAHIFYDFNFRIFSGANCSLGHMKLK